MTDIQIALANMNAQVRTTSLHVSIPIEQLHALNTVVSFGKLVPEYITKFYSVCDAGTRARFTRSSAIRYLDVVENEAVRRVTDALAGEDPHLPF